MDIQPSEEQKDSSSSSDCADSPSTSPVRCIDDDDTSRPAAPSPVSSPVCISPPSSPPKQPIKKRKLYTFASSQVPPAKTYWPHEDEAGVPSGLNFNEMSIEFENNQDESGSVHSEPNFDGNEDERGFERPYSPVDSTQSDKSDSEKSSSSAPSSSLSGSVRSNSPSNNSEVESESEDDECIPFGSLSVSNASALSIDEGIILVMDLYIKDRLKKGSVDSILKLIQRFLPDNNLMPTSKHSIFKYIEEIAPPVKENVYFYCKDCLYYLGKTSKVCPLCKCEQNNKFYQLSLADQIKNLFECHNLANIIDKYSEQRTANTDFSDICDGSEYKRARLPGKYDLTLMGHLDGVSVSESSNLSMWALEFVICEIPFNVRYKFVLIAGIWMDSSKPIMGTYMKPFLLELKELFHSGVHWVHPRTKVRERSCIVVPCFCADAPARALLQQILCHGGRYCCHTCEQKMVKLPAEPVQPGVKRERRKRVFTFQEEVSPLRTDEKMKLQTESVVENRRITGNVSNVKGVTGKCIVSELPHCDRSTFVFPEYMHLLIGIIKLFFELFFEINGDWSLKEHRKEIDEFLEKIRVPDFLTRTPRSTQSYSQWKANELRSFLLFFSLVVFKKFMSDKYFQHWILLVSAMFLLLEDSVSDINIKKAELLFKMFLREFSSLYPLKSFTYNLHLLSHLGLTVRRWGPLGRTSAFPFENFNGALSSCIHGKRNLAKELTNTVRIVQGVEILKARTLVASQNNNTVESNAFFCNLIRDYCFTAEQNNMLLNENLSAPYLVYYRLRIGKITYTTLAYKRQLRRNNYTVCILHSEKKQYGEIMYFLEDKFKVKRAFVKTFIIEHDRTFCHEDSRHVVKHMIPIKESNNVLLIPIQDIQYKVIRVEDYVCLRPNRYEYNL